MKKILAPALLLGMAVCFSYCHSSKKAAAAAPAAAPAAVTYSSSIQPIIMSKCSPCHIPSAGGNKEALDSYAGVSKNIDGILRRIQLNPTDRGFMPAKHDKLNDSTIAVIQKWKDAGLAEK